MTPKSDNQVLSVSGQSQKSDKSNYSKKKNDKTKNKMQVEGKTSGRWGQSEKAKYYTFLVINQSLFMKNDKRRNDRVFKMMSNYIISRSPDQCRSHHQKIENKYPNITKILAMLNKKFGGIDIKKVIKDNMLSDSTKEEPPSLNLPELKIVPPKKDPKQHQHNNIDGFLVRYNQPANLNTGTWGCYSRLMVSGDENPYLHQTESFQNINC